MSVTSELRAIASAHRIECGERAEQLMVNDRIYPAELDDWANKIDTLERSLEFALRLIRGNLLPHVPDEQLRDNWRDYIDLVLSELDAEVA